MLRDEFVLDQVLSEVAQKELILQVNMIQISRSSLSNQIFTSSIVYKNLKIFQTCILQGLRQIRIGTKLQEALVSIVMKGGPAYI